MVMAVVDSGTTNTRLRRMENGRVTACFTQKVGARDGKAAIAFALSALLPMVSDAELVVLSGMITSPTGLLEVPHIAGPVNLDELPLVRHDFPEIDSRPFYFVPGVAFREGDLAHRDMMRGEETELLGYGLDEKTRVFLHAGSHHKAMCTEHRRLTTSATAITGELLSAMAEHTLIASSLDLSVKADLSLFNRAAELTCAQGFARAAFVLRMLDVQEHASPEVRLGWAYGMMAGEDLSLLLPMLTEKTEIVFYGREDFCRAMAKLPQLEKLDKRVLTQEESDLLAPMGAWRLGERVL